MLQPLGVNVVLLTGSLKGQKRDRALKAIESGPGQVTIGTHALIQDSFSLLGNLGLLIFDEQHRFGVRQRMAFLSERIIVPTCW
ncbi:MAG: hypothetical protein CM1200mP14_29250 [Gammaproteobacteria bacterium]|nr:MAG: hypothetical protein CM1200mP14_29250 [Gammaproteobacteria bacterium]